jgi:hypothetical protein
MTRTLVLFAVACALLVVAALSSPDSADAAYQGSDVFSNVAPPAQIDRTSGLMHRYPSGNYALDTHVDVGVTNPGALFALVPHLLASQIWDLTRLLVLAVISLFTWAFSLDLLNGSGGNTGALAPIANAIDSLYTHSLGRSWLVVGILLAGLWGIWKALVQRRYLETAGQLALSVAFVVLALFFVQRPEQTIGRASEWTNQLSLAFLSGATRGSVNSPETAKQEVADHLFRTLVYEPWVVLNFGGLRHCVDADHRPVAPDDPRRARCIEHVTAASGRGGYAERFLRYRPGSEARNAEYEALRDGAIPSDSRVDSIIDAFSAAARGDLADAFAATAEAVDPADPTQFNGYTVDADDRPAVDLQQQGGGFQRLTMALLVFAGTLGAVLLLGALSLGVVLAQVIVLFFLAFAPLALIAAVYPGRGHDLFRAWLGRLVDALLRKALYSLVLAVILAVSSALLAATSSLGWLLAFGLQTAFYWTVFLFRKDIAARFALATRASDGPAGHRRLPRSLRNIPRQLRRTPTSWAARTTAERHKAQTPAATPGAPASGTARRGAPGARDYGEGRQPPARRRRPPDPGRDATGAPPAPAPQAPDTTSEPHQDAPTPPTRTRQQRRTTAPVERSPRSSQPAVSPKSDSADRGRTRSAATHQTSEQSRTTNPPTTLTRRSDGDSEAIRDELERDRQRLDQRAPHRNNRSSTGRFARRFPWRRP